MTSIGLISDTHGFLDETVFDHFKNCDEIWHAGDFGNIELANRLATQSGKTTRGVYGNIDDRAVQEIFPEWLEFEAEGVKILMTHIGGKPPRYAKGVKERIKSSKAQVFICGHSHICKVELDRELNCLYMNPGAVGQQGFHPIRTLLLFDLDRGKITNLRVVELGKRGVIGA